MRVIDRTDLERVHSYLDDPGMTLNLLNTCHPVGWHVTYAQHVLTLRCLDCDLPFYYIATVGAPGGAARADAYLVELEIVNTCHVGRGWDLTYLGGHLTLSCPECEVPVYGLTVGWPC